MIATYLTPFFFRRCLDLLRAPRDTIARHMDLSPRNPVPSPARGEPLPVGSESDHRTRPRVLAAVTVGHLAIDIWNSMGPVLLAFLRTPLGLSTAQVGLAIGLYQMLAGSTQPIFGWLVDRVGSRFLGPASVTMTVVSVCFAVHLAVTTRRFELFLALFALAAIGSGAFHPQGTMHAGTPQSGQAATTTAVFFLFGQVGLAIGPPLAGLALDTRGPTGLYLLAGILVPVALFMALAMTPARHNPSPTRPSGREGAERAEPTTVGGGGMGAASLLTIIFAGRAWILIGTAAFLPLLFQSRGWSSTRQGLLVGAFWFGGAVCGVLAGLAADRGGRRKIAALTTVAGAVSLWFLPVSDGQLALPLAFLTGGLLGAPHSVLMVLAQRLLPVQKGLASGLALGFLFTMGAVGSWSIGLLAEHYDLARVLQAGAIIGVVVGFACLLLPSSRVLAAEVGARDVAC